MKTAEDIEAELLLWGAWCRAFSDCLGYPSSSTIARMIEHVKVFERESTDAIRLTANGRQRPVMIPPKVDLPPDGIQELDARIAKLPGWMNAVIRRSYLWRQPDRIAARELRISRALYTSRRQAAIAYLGGLQSSLRSVG